MIAFPRVPIASSNADVGGEVFFVVLCSKNTVLFFLFRLKKSGSARSGQRASPPRVVWLRSEWANWPVDACCAPVCRPSARGIDLARRAQPRAQPRLCPLFCARFLKRHPRYLGSTFFPFFFFFQTPRSNPLCLMRPVQKGQADCASN